MESMSRSLINTSGVSLAISWPPPCTAMTIRGVMSYSLCPGNGLRLFWKLPGCICRVLSNLVTERASFCVAEMERYGNDSLENGLLVTLAKNPAP
jgi:hypothetical protein